MRELHMGLSAMQSGRPKSQEDRCRSCNPSQAAATVVSHLCAVVLMGVVLGPALGMGIRSGQVATAVCLAVQALLALALDHGVGLLWLVPLAGHKVCGLHPQLAIWLASAHVRRCCTQVR